MSTRSRGIIGVIIGIVISILVGIIVVSSIISGVNTSSWSSQAQQTWTQLQTNIWIVFGLLVILPLIIGAAVLMRYMGGGGI